MSATTLDFTRQREWFDPSRHAAGVTVVGCGGIGSFTAFALAKLGITDMTLIDPDTVEEHNIPNQMFPWNASLGGTDKVEALAETLDVWTPGLRINDLPRPLEDGVPLSPVVISALDSMEARAALWQQVRYKAACALFLDGRLGGQHVVLYAVNPTSPADVAGYEATLHSDDEGLELSCTARSIIDVGFAIGSLMTRAVRRHLTHQEVERVVYLDQANLEIMKGGWS